MTFPDKAASNGMPCRLDNVNTTTGKAQENQDAEQLQGALSMAKGGLHHAQSAIWHISPQQTLGA